MGFLSFDKIALANAKYRDINQPFLICVDTIKKQKCLARTPQKYKKMIRRSNKTSFIYPNKKAIRVVKEGAHNKFLRKFDFLYSSSANISGKDFDTKFAYNKADIIVLDKRGLHSSQASKIYKISKYKISKIR